MDKLPEKVQACLSEVKSLKEIVRGDLDLELVVLRMEQMEQLLEALAELKAAKEEMQRTAAECKAAAARKDLRSPIP